MNLRLWRFALESFLNRFQFNHSHRNYGNLLAEANELHAIHQSTSPLGNVDSPNETVKSATTSAGRVCRNVLIQSIRMIENWVRKRSIAHATIAIDAQNSLKTSWSRRKVGSLAFFVDVACSFSMCSMCVCVCSFRIFRIVLRFSISAFVRLSGA